MGDHPEAQIIVHGPVVRRLLVFRFPLSPRDLLLGKLPNALGCERVQREPAALTSLRRYCLVVPHNPSRVQEVG